MRRARADAFERIGHRHAEVVVAGDGDVDVLDALDVFTQVGDEVIHLLRRGVADGVGHIQRRRARGDGSGVAMGQKCPVGAGGVLGGKLDVIAIALGVGDHLADAVDDLLARHLELVLHVDVARRKEDMDAGVVRFLHGVPRRVDIALGAARERGDRAVRHRGGDGLHALVVKIPPGQALLCRVDAQLFKLAGHFDLFRQIHAAAGGLLAVSQGRVKNFNAFHGVFLLLFFLSHSNKKSLRLFP